MVEKYQSTFYFGAHRLAIAVIEGTRECVVYHEEVNARAVFPRASQPTSHVPILTCIGDEGHIGLYSAPSIITLRFSWWV